ncbi:hypothetical protein GB937_001706 [Aspergillus fischeri]|nr:hypothetical protein GB937_001706 [Aspergillus fischeri]
MFLNPVFESNLLLPRQLNNAYNGCSGGIGDGECLPSSQCTCAPYSCCLHRQCTVSEGTGYCRDASNQTCEEGAYFTGTSVELTRTKRKTSLSTDRNVSSTPGPVRGRITSNAA